MLPKSKEIYSSGIIKGYSGFSFFEFLPKWQELSGRQCLGACRFTRTMGAFHTECQEDVTVPQDLPEKDLTSVVNPEHSVKKHTQEVKKILAPTHWRSKSARGWSKVWILKSGCRGMRCREMCSAVSQLDHCFPEDDLFLFLFFQWLAGKSHMFKLGKYYRCCLGLVRKMRNEFSFVWVPWFAWSWLHVQQTPEIRLDTSGSKWKSTGEEVCKGCLEDTSWLAGPKAGWSKA